MKKLNCLFTVLFASLLFAFVSCGSTPAASASGEGDKTLAFVVLSSNPSTGYSWSCSVKDTAVAELSSNEYVAASAENGLVGAGGVHYFVFKGKKAGETEVNFAYARANASPSQKRTYKVTVLPDLSTGLELVSLE